MACEHVEILRGSKSALMTFRLRPESEKAKAAFAKGKSRLTYRGTILEMFDVLAKRNREGFAIYYTVNPTDGRGAKRENVTQIVGLPLDLDGAPLPKDDKWKGGLKPHIIIETSPRKYQCIFRIKPTKDFDAAKNMARRLAATYRGDPSVCNASRILRMAGFAHQKGKPCISSVIETNEFEPPYALEQFDAVLKHVPRSDSSSSTPGGIGSLNVEGARRLLDDLDPAEVCPDNERWEALAMALHSASNGDGEVQDYFMSWCSRDDNYDDEEAEARNIERYTSFTADRAGGRGVGTLRHLLRRHGVSEGTIASALAANDFDDGGEDDTWLEGGGLFEDWLEGKKSKPVLHEVGGLLYQNATEVEPERINWLWPDRIASGKINFVAGYPDQGKSQITCDMAARVSNGADWPNGEGQAALGTVLMLSAEDGAADTIVPRLKAAGADLDKIKIVAPTVMTDAKGRRMFNLAEDLGRLTRLVRACDDVRLVVIDPISAYMGGKGTADTYKNTEVRAVLAPLAEWAELHDVAVIFVSHFNKNGSGRALSRLTDSLAFGALARCGWLVVPERDEDGETGRKLFLRGKNNLAADAGGIVYTIESRTIEGDIEAPYIVWHEPIQVTADDALGQGDVRATAQDQAADFLSSALADGPVPVAQLKDRAAARSISWRTVERAKDLLGVTSQKLNFGRGWQWRMHCGDELEFG
jgi:hypothetical protein